MLDMLQSLQFLISQRSPSSVSPGSMWSQVPCAEQPITHENERASAGYKRLTHAKHQAPTGFRHRSVDAHGKTVVVQYKAFP